MTLAELLSRGAPDDAPAGLLNTPFIGNPNITRQAARAGVGTRPDNFTGPASAFLGGLFGTAPDEQGGSVLDPASARNSPNAANAGFMLGTAAQVAPLVKGLLSLGKAVPEALSFASRSAKMEAPRPVPQRPFSDDYPSASASNGSGQLTADIEGRTLGAQYVAGRRMVGGPDQAIDAAGIEKLAGLLGAKTRFANASDDIGTDLGRYVVGSDRDGNALRQILLSPSLTAQQAPHVYAHEVGHLVDNLTFGQQIPTAGVKREASQVYSDLNSTMYVPKGKIGATPQTFGYKGDNIPAELNAEGLRAYMQNPNYFKSTAPNLAARYREYVNNNPNINQVLQLNSAGAGLGAGLLGSSYGDSKP